MTTRLIRAAIAAFASTAVLAPAAMAAGNPTPGSPAYIERDLANIEAANGRQTAPDGHLNDPDFTAAQADAEAAGAGDEDPYRVGTWNGIRGQFRDVTFADSSSPGETFAGRVYAPRPGATHPDTGQPLVGPFPGAVIVSGTGQASGHYAWAAEDLAERGYVTLTFTVTKQQGAPRYFAAAKDAVDFFWSTPSTPVAGERFNPYWSLFDRATQRVPSTSGRPYRFALIGHSIGAAAVSALANMDPRVSALVAWDKLIKSNAYFVGGETLFNPGQWRPTVPALGVHSEYSLRPTPYVVGCGLPFGCDPYMPTEGPPPDRELSVAYGGSRGWGIVSPQPGGWVAAGVDVMLLVLRASTHVEYEDEAASSASRYGKAVTSYYQTAWLDRYLKQDPSADRRLEATSLRQLEPRAHGVWKATPELRRDDQLSFYFCSAWRYHSLDGRLVAQMDPTGAGCDATADGLAVATRDRAASSNTPAAGRALASRVLTSMNAPGTAGALDHALGDERRAELGAATIRDAGTTRPAAARPRASSAAAPVLLALFLAIASLALVIRARPRTRRVAPDKSSS